MATFKYIMTEPNYTPDNKDDILAWYIRVNYISPTSPTEIQTANFFDGTAETVQKRAQDFIDTKLTLPDEPLTFSEPDGV